MKRTFIINFEINTGTKRLKLTAVVVLKDERIPSLFSKMDDWKEILNPYIDGYGEDTVIESVYGVTELIGNDICCYIIP